MMFVVLIPRVFILFIREILLCKKKLYVSIVFIILYHVLFSQIFLLLKNVSTKKSKFENILIFFFFFLAYVQLSVLKSLVILLVKISSFIFSSFTWDLVYKFFKSLILKIKITILRLSIE